MNKRISAVIAAVFVFFLVGFMDVNVFAATDNVTMRLNDTQELSVSEGITEGSSVTFTVTSGTDIMTLVDTAGNQVSSVEQTASAQGASTTVKAIGTGNATVSCRVNGTEVRSFSFQVYALVSGITLSETSVEMIPGKTMTLTSVITPENASNQSLLYSSSNTKVASVSNTGEVTANKTGSAVITVKAADGSGATATCTVKVKKAVKTITLNATEVTLKIGETKKLKATVAPKKASSKVTFTSKNTNVATVSEKGVITGNDVGTTKIVVKAADGSGVKAVCKVTVKAKNAGWNKTKSGKKYYILDNGKKASGYTEINGDYYYFDPDSGTMVTKKWVYVTLDGKKYKLYFKKNGKQSQNVEKLLHTSDYKLIVNRTTNMVTVYAKDGDNGYIIPVKAFVCSVGVNADGTRTPAGTFTIHRVAKWHTLMGDCYGKYCTRINGGVLFHSVWYYENGNSKSQSVRAYARLGQNASHGCVRLTVGAAKWIYENCDGCTTTILSSKKQEPLKKPVAGNNVRVSGDYGYDPTDTEVAK